MAEMTGRRDTPVAKVPMGLWISAPLSIFVVSVTWVSRYRDRDTRPVFLKLQRTAMIIPFDIALALAGGSVFFAFVVALAAD
jgi:hypothetical protein